MSPRITLVALCLAALGAAHTTAQQRPAPLQLVPTGRAFARGDGDVARCLIRDDSNHMLTVGVANDLVWWDLRERRPLRWVPPPDAPLLDVQLHPTEPWAVCRFDDGTAHRVNLASGSVQMLSRAEAKDLPVPTGGWLTGGPGSRDDVVSRDGSHRLVMSANGFRRRQPAVAGQFFDTYPYWLANDGTAIGTWPGVVFIRGLTLGDRTDFHVHCAPPQQVCFTADGNHLAILCRWMTQIVDVAGVEIARFDGPHLVRPGPGPDEFWLITETRMRRWSTQQRAFGDNAVEWPGNHLRLMEGGWRLREVLVRQGQPWTPEAARLPDGTLRTLVMKRPLNRIEVGVFGVLASEHPVAFGDGAGNPLLLTSISGNPKGVEGRATLWRFDEVGGNKGHLPFSCAALWLACSADGTRAWIGLETGVLHAIDTERLTTTATAKFAPRLATAIVLDDRHLLATTGGPLLRVDATTLATVDEVPLPQGLRGVDRLVSSADGKRLAIVRGCEVWLLQVQ